MKMVAISQELSSTSYPGRGIITGRSADGSKAVTAYVMMARGVNSADRGLVEDRAGIRPCGASAGGAGQENSWE